MFSFAHVVSKIQSRLRYKKPFQQAVVTKNSRRVDSVLFESSDTQAFTKLLWYFYLHNLAAEEKSPAFVNLKLPASRRPDQENPNSRNRIVVIAMHSVAAVSQFNCKPMNEKKTWTRLTWSWWSRDL